MPDTPNTATSAGAASRDARTPEIVLDFEHVDLALDNKDVLRDITFRLSRGETKIVLGVAASGKSVLLKTAIGLFRPDSGSVRLFGEDITRLSEPEMYPLRQRVGMVFQESALFDSLDVADNVSYVFQEDRSLDPEEEQRRVHRALQFVGLEDTAAKLPSELSGGMRRRVAIARGFIGEPPLMLYDSPTAGLDPVTAQSIVTLVMKLGELQKVSSLLVTHRLQDVHVIANYVFDPKTGELAPRNTNGNRTDVKISFLVMREGEVVYNGDQAGMLHSRDPYVRKFIA